MDAPDIKPRYRVISYAMRSFFKHTAKAEWNLNPGLFLSELSSG